jgi:hypothetical protein
VGSPAPQPAMPPLRYGARPRPTVGMRVARRGFAVVRLAFLVAFTGVLVAAVVGTVVAALIIAVNGRLS